MAIKKVEAVVIKRYPVRETSLIVTFFSKQNGKIRGLVKGARQEKNPLSARFEPFTRLSVVYYEKTKSDTHLISETSVLESNSFLRDRLDHFAYGSYMVELIDAFFDLYDPYPEVYDLLRASFRALTSALPTQVARIFEVKLFELLGILPALSQCAMCGRQNLDLAYFSPAQGGIICPRCDRYEADTVRVSKGTLQSIAYFLNHPVKTAIKLRLGPQIEKELERIQVKFLQYRLEYPLKTPNFLHEIESLTQKS